MEYRSLENPVYFIPPEATGHKFMYLAKCAFDAYGDLRARGVVHSLVIPNIPSQIALRKSFAEARKKGTQLKDGAEDDLCGMVHKLFPVIVPQMAQMILTERNPTAICSQFARALQEWKPHLSEFNARDEKLQKALRLDEGQLDFIQKRVEEFVVISSKSAMDRCQGGRGYFYGLREQGMSDDEIMNELYKNLSDVYFADFRAMIMVTALGDNTEPFLADQCLKPLPLVMSTLHFD